MNPEELRKILRSEKAVIGTEITLKKLKQGKLVKVYLAKNCPEDTKDDLKHYTTLAKIETEQLDTLNKELGTICKRPFSVSVVGIEK